MDSPDFFGSAADEKSPRRELQLQGPRPTPLKVRKESHKIKKPPIAPPQPSHHHHHQQPPPQHRPPVIIYTVSPKVIHTNPSDFMTLVQRLTGSSSSSSYSSNISSSSHPLFDNTTAGAISPAARYATIEKTKSPEGKKTRGGDVGIMERTDMTSEMVERATNFPGILSPGPAALTPIAPNFFSPPADPNSFSSFYHDLSPVQHGNKTFLEGSFMPSPSTFFFSPNTTSPTPSLDLFNNFFDF